MKLTAKLLILAIFFNLLSAPINAHSFANTPELGSLFGEEIYICSADNSFDVSINEYEKLLFSASLANDYQNFQISNIDIYKPSIFRFEFERAISLIKFQNLLPANLGSNLYQQFTSRAPPYYS